MPDDRYDEFAFFHENADEFGIPYDGPPAVRRVPPSSATAASSARSCGATAEPGARVAPRWRPERPHLGHGRPRPRPPAGRRRPARSRPLRRRSQRLARRARQRRRRRAIVSERWRPTPSRSSGCRSAACHARAHRLGTRAGPVARAGRRHPRGDRPGSRAINASSTARRASPTSTRSSPARSSSTRRAPCPRCAGASSTTPCSATTAAGCGATPASGMSARRGRVRPTLGGRGRRSSGVDGAADARSRACCRSRSSTTPTRPSCSAVPAARVEQIAHAGHSVQGDTPVELARLIADFAPPPQR